MPTGSISVFQSGWLTPVHTFNFTLRRNNERFNSQVRFLNLQKYPIKNPACFCLGCFCLGISAYFCVLLQATGSGLTKTSEPTTHGCVPSFCSLRPCFFCPQDDITPIPFCMYFTGFNGVLNSTIGFRNVGTIVVFAGAEIRCHFWEIVL